VLELIHSGLNFIFDICFVFMVNYFLVRDDVPVDNEVFLVTVFINIKIKSIQSFKNIHRV
jgi:hypothetical protein